MTNPEWWLETENKRLHPARSGHSGKMSKSSSTMNFQVKTPSKLRCSLCGALIIGEPCMEQRPTGKDGKAQSWAYCATDWEWMQTGIMPGISVSDNEHLTKTRICQQ